MRSDTGENLLVGIELAERERPPLARTRIPFGIGIDAVDGARGQALVAPAAQFGDDHDVGAVVEDRTELVGTMAEARVAVDALRHLDPQWRVFPFGIPLARFDALEPRAGGHTNAKA